MLKKYFPSLTKEISLILSAFIFLTLVLPSGGLMRDYNTDYCNDSSGGQLTSGEVISKNVHYYYPFYLNKDVGFFSCEIGYIDGYAHLSYQVSFPSTFEADMLILDYSNYNKYLNGEVYGVNNIDLIGLENGFTLSQSEPIQTTFLPSNYFFIINWDYRTNYSSEDVERPYFLDHTDTPTNVGGGSKSLADICPAGLADYPSYTWETADCTMFNYYLDIDYVPNTGPLS